VARALRGQHAADRRCGSRKTTNFTKGDTMKRVILLALAATFALPSFALLSGCNTIEGAGKDVKATGSAVENAADKAKPTNN
jgi:predicted small secreted protein